MSIKLQFWQTKNLSGGITYESLDEAFKNLPEGAKTYSDEYMKKYFEHIQLNYLRISEAQLEKAIPDYNKELKYSLFDPQEATFFMMDHQTWRAIQAIIESSIKKAINEEEQSLEERLERTIGIAKDCECLSTLFSKRALFLAIF